MASDKKFFIFYDFYAIKHNGTKMCHEIVHFLDVMLLCGCGFLGEVIGPHVNMRIAIDLTCHLLLPYFTCTTATFCFVVHTNSFVKISCNAQPSNAVENIKMT